MSADETKETLGFQAEVRQLLDLMIHSLYSNKEIFLRELVSNASDAADKLRFEALADEALYGGDGELRIEIESDAEARTVTVRDNGIGMSRAEVVDNLGTIARSGTRRFLETLTGDAARDARLIGQFGVGFYSSFIVAGRVRVTTRRAGLAAAEGVRWESDGQGEFTVESLEVPARGTEVVLELKEGEDDLLDLPRLRAIVQRYSDHISWPIRMPTAEGGRWETVNSATALWTRPRSEITDEEYQAFYRHVAHDPGDPLAWVHSRVEGKVEYTSLLYLPERAPFDLWDRNVRRGMKLYVRRVFILDDAEQLLPPYLRFVRGVVDAADLPLNVSREMLQEDRQLEVIRAGSVKRVLDLLTGMARDEPERYQRFWGEFGRVLKEGLIDDPKNRDVLARLLRFASTASEGDGQKVSLADYVARMGEGQKPIWYLTGDSLSAARGSPHLEAFRARGLEVLLLTDEVDEWLVHHLPEFEEHPLQSVARGELDLDELGGAETQAPEKPDPGAHAGLVASLKGELDGRVREVRVSERLVDSAACLVSEHHELGKRLERMLRAAGQVVPPSLPTLEVNPRHLLLRRYTAEVDPERRAALAQVVLDQAVLAEGGRLEDPAGFVHRLNQLLAAMAGGEGGASVPDLPRPAEDAPAHADEGER